MLNRYTVPVVTVLLIILLLVVVPRLHDTASDVSHTDISNIVDLVPGDLVLRQGTGVWSKFITQYLQDGSGMSHVGILYNRDARWYVLHTLSGALQSPDGIRMELLDDFVGAARDGQIMIVRPRFLTDSGRLSFLESGLVQLNQAVPFDLDFDWSDSDSLFCSELVFRLLMNASPTYGEDDLYWTGRLPRFSSFLRPDYFEIVLDHRAQ